MSAKIGNKVKFLNEKGEGTIKKILENNHYVVTTTDGFDYNVSSKEIVIINDDNSYSYEIDSKEIEQKIKVNIPPRPTEKSTLNQYLQSTKYLTQKIIEVDLHLEELVEFPGKLDDWQKLYTQMQHVRKCLNAAFDQNTQKIIFIHGVGQGILKTEIKNYLSTLPNITFTDADFREYGQGATEVTVN